MTGLVFSSPRAGSTARSTISADMASPPLWLFLLRLCFPLLRRRPAPFRLLRLGGQPGCQLLLQTARQRLVCRPNVSPLGRVGHKVEELGRVVLSGEDE